MTGTPSNPDPTSRLITRSGTLVMPERVIRQICVRGWPDEPRYPGCVTGVAASPRSNARTSDSRNLRCPPGVRMLLIRPDAAHRVTVFGSTRKSAATSPGVSRRSLLPSTFHPSYLRFGACHQCGENIRLLPCFPQNGPLVLVVSFALGRRGLPAGGTGDCRSGLAGDHGRRSAGMWRDGRDGLAGHGGLDYGMARRY